MPKTSEPAITTSRRLRKDDQAPTGRDHRVDSIQFGVLAPDPVDEHDVHRASDEPDHDSAEESLKPRLPRFGLKEIEASDRRGSIPTIPGYRHEETGRIDEAVMVRHHDRLRHLIDSIES